MGNVITLRPSLDVNYIYNCSDGQLFEYIYPFNSSIDTRHTWFAIVARENKTTSTKIKNIFYGNSKLTSIERIYFEDKARYKLQNKIQTDPRQTAFYLRGCNG